MSEDDYLIKELEKLSAASKSARGVDSIVENRINFEGRKMLLKNLHMINDRLRRDLALDSLVPGDKPMVRSHPSLVVPHNIVQEIETNDSRLTMPLQISGPKALGGLDNKFDRTLTFDEYTSRFEILVNKIMEGKLDDKLGITAEVIIHGIMGLSGELLFYLAIDPRKGETWRLIEAETKPIENPEKNEDLFKKAEPGLIKFIEELLRNWPKTSTTARVEVAEKSDSSGIVDGKPIGSIIGLRVFSLNDDIVSRMDLRKETRGVLVSYVFKRSLADRAGFQMGDTPAVIRGIEVMLGGDVIVSVDEVPVKDVKEFSLYLGHYHAPGTRIRFGLIRNGESVELSIVY